MGEHAPVTLRAHTHNHMNACSHVRVVKCAHAHASTHVPVCEHRLRRDHVHACVCTNVCAWVGRERARVALKPSPAIWSLCRCLVVPAPASGYAQLCHLSGPCTAGPCCSPCESVPGCRCRGVRPGLGQWALLQVPGHRLAVVPRLARSLGHDPPGAVGASSSLGCRSHTEKIRKRHGHPGRVSSQAGGPHSRPVLQHHLCPPAGPV